MECDLYFRPSQSSVIFIAFLHRFVSLFIHHMFLLHENLLHAPSSPNPRQAIPPNIARYRKAVYSALWVQVALFICYLPFGIIQALTDLKSVKVSSSAYLAKTFLFAFVFLNSSLNPLIYCWKMKEVRQAVKDTIRKIYCSLT